MKKLLALLVVLGMVNVASAGYTPVGTLTGETFDSAGVTYNQWIVNLSADNGGLAAIDGQFNGNFLQRTVFTRPTTSSNWTKNYTTYADMMGYEDTSLLFTSPDGLLPVTIAEDSNAVPPTLAVANGKTKVVYGTGTFFKIVTGFMPDLDQSAGIDLVSLWVPAGEEANVSFTGLYSRMGDNGAKSVMNFPLVPEPATMGLLAIGALGLLRRKHA